MSYQEYKQARDAAWQVLIECDVSELPVRPSAICKHYGWKLADYCSTPIYFSVSVWLMVLEGMLADELSVDILHTKYVKRIFFL